MIYPSFSFLNDLKDSNEQSDDIDVQHHRTKNVIINSEFNSFSSLFYISNPHIKTLPIFHKHALGYYY